MSTPSPHTDPIPEVLTIDKPEQLKALGHPLRLRVLETLGETETPMSNRELAQRLGVDPGHLHFHVRMLLRAGLINQVPSAKGREKPYRSAAQTLKVAPELVSAGASELQATIVEDVQRGWNAYADEGQFRFVRINARVSPEKALEVLSELVPTFDKLEDESEDMLTITAIMHPQRPEEKG
ncbi:MAG TPA: helix-turn-helix domain-containing protein [Gaiellaceae bacterium]|jgi:DNA-binding transcriptional ArsR family regulator|nr:helix-turn-helix domain-containing protein [Gaiellaceae bacterium]